MDIGILIKKFIYKQGIGWAVFWCDYFIINYRVVMIAMPCNY